MSLWRELQEAEACDAPDLGFLGLLPNVPFSVTGTHDTIASGLESMTLIPSVLD